MPKKSKLTSKQLREVPCIECNAGKDHYCVNPNGSVMVGFHPKRQELRERYPVLHEEAEKLNATDKSVLTYYAFVMLSNSCAANSVKLFGKEMSSAEIQRYFAQQALWAAREDGVIKK